MSSITLTLNGETVQADSGKTLLDVARERGIHIPTLCHDSRLKPYGSCRVCLVKVEGARNYVPACSTYGAEGMIIDTEDPDVVAARRMSLALLISDHDGDCVSPCSLECPAHIDIQGYIALIRAGRFQEAVKLIKERNPMPVTIGRVCPHPCEEVCRRSRVDEPIAINNLKRFAADYDIALTQPFIPEPAEPKNQRVAVVGAGPAGLSAAYYLALSGYGVTIFEQKPEPGGMLRYGIPEYRLPREILDREIELIRSLGIEIRFDTAFGRDLSLKGLNAEGYEALFLAIGAGRSTDMRIEGEGLPGVLSGIDFLADMAMGLRRDFRGQTVIVVGGGNTAMDASRTSLRLGAAKVIVLYRRTRKEMPAHDFEIRETEEEGIEFQYLSAPVRVSEDGDGLAIECIRMELGPPDDSGRRRPVPLKDSNYSIKAHYLITAIGQRPDVSCIEQPDLVGARDRVKADPETCQTDLDHVFAGGDCVTGAATAIEAVAAGRRAALSIGKYLRSKIHASARSGVSAISEGAVEDPAHMLDAFNISKGRLEDIPESVFERYEKQPRVHMPAVEPGIRVSDFRQIETGLAEEAAKHEAERCIECGCIEGFTCDLRNLCSDYQVAPDSFPGEKNRYPEHNNLLSAHPPIVRDENKCIKCGICVRICDEVWGLSVYGYVGRGFETEITPSFGLSHEKTACDFCGQCADSCPTGALAINPYFPKPGPLEGTKVRGTCVLCSIGCTMDFNVYGNTILKTTAEPGIGENGGNLCVRGRYGYRYLLPWNRCMEYLEFDGEGRVALTAVEALQKTAALLKNPGKCAIVTSTSLSDEEYGLVNALAGRIEADLFHLAIDGAEEHSRHYPVAGRSGALAELAGRIPTADLSDLPRSRNIVLFNMTPGRSFPILEMCVRQAVAKGVRLYIVGERPTRLDDCAEAVFRLKAPLYGDFLRLSGMLRAAHTPNPDETALGYFAAHGIPEDLVSRMRVKPSKIARFAGALGEHTIYIIDEDATARDDLEAFMMHALLRADSSKLMRLRRGANPAGAEKTSRRMGPPERLDAGTLQGYTTLMLLKTPKLPVTAGQRVAHIGFSPYTLYTPGSIFIPSSSLLETGGTTHLYSEKEVELLPVLDNHAGIDNTKTLTRLIERLG